MSDPSSTPDDHRAPITDLFERASIPRAYFTLALPVVASMVVSLVYNMVDTFFVAHTGNQAMVAGVSLAAPVFTVMLALGDIFGLGGSSVISRLFGEGRFTEGKRISVLCFWSALACGLAVVAVMLTLETPIVRLLGAGPDTWDHATQYYRWIVIGAPFIIVSMVPSNLLRAEGFATPSMIGTVSGTVINIILNPILISVVGWGAAGSAIATVIGNVCADAYFVWFLLRRSRHLSIAPRLLRVSWRQVGGVLLIGLPASVTNLMQSLGIVLVNHFLLPYGTTAIAAMGIALKITMIAVLILVGFSFGAQPLIGFTYGAGNFTRLGAVLRFAYLFEGGLALALTVVLSVPAPAIVRFFLDDPEVVAEGATMMRWQLSSMVCVAIVLVTMCAFQSMGKAVGAFLLAIGRQGVFLALVLSVASRLVGYEGVIAAQPGADLLTAALAVVLFALGWHRGPGAGHR